MEEKYIFEQQEISTALPDNPEDRKYQELYTQYALIRRIRGDGNCFYRAVAFGCLESFRNTEGMQMFRDTVLRSSKVLTISGISEDRFRALFSTFVNVVERSEADAHGNTLLEMFNEQTTSDSVVQYLRFLTSAHLQNHSERFQHFVEAPNLKAYCTQEVETMAMECDHVEILALSEALGVTIRIVSVEGGSGSLVFHTIPEEVEATLHLLYKNSHYDLLYPVSPH
ncbi:ubiquitin thioesterase OTUB2 [Paramormyrops kingsleyae]|uniref:ubiquitinyl hydrolase 1 n=1 Tax=Paramormyrops kingsleyae TaxID=1676925 RepID=A0A3B3RRH1_9TELE|nr:ubiquitin thioesterase OTUB2 [Paramormyrops kingsleyae]